MVFKELNGKTEVEAEGMKADRVYEVISVC